MKIGNRYNRCVYKCVFPDKSIYFGITYNFTNRKQQREMNNNDSVTKYFNTTKQPYKMIQITDYLPLNEAQQLERDLIKKYRNIKEYNVLNIKDGGELGGSQKYSFDYCKEVAQKYERKCEFHYYDFNCYLAAMKMGILKNICSHMKKGF